MASLNARLRCKGITVLTAMAVFVVFAATALAGDEFKVISTEELKSLMDKKANVVLIDARTPDEYREAHIAGAINIPEKGIEKGVTQLPEERRTPLIFYCNGVKCGKSSRVAKLVAPLGYTDISIYSEGIPVWEERNLPLTTGPGYGKKIETAKLRPAEIDQMIKAGSGDFIIVDVRDTAEFREGHIPGAVNIPAETFATQSGVLPKDKKIVVYCNTGSRSYLAYKKLIGLAYPKIHQALFAEWKEAGLPVAE